MLVENVVGSELKKIAVVKVKVVIIKDVLREEDPRNLLLDFSNYFVN
jgi:hypothetical protein